MADTPNPPTPEQANQVLTQVQQPPTPPVPKIRIETKTGRVYEGATQDEVLQKLVEAQDNAVVTIKQMNDRLNQMQQQPPAPPAPPQPAPQKTFQDQYFEIWQRDPIAADRYAASVRLGVPMEQVDQVERQTMQSAAIAQQNSAASEFIQRCPDYPEGDKEVAAAMGKRLLERYPGQVPTADHLELVFNDLVRNGVVTPREIPITGNEGGPRPLPTLGSSAQAPTVDFERQFRGLSTEQMKKAIEELHAKGLR